MKSKKKKRPKFLGEVGCCSFNLITNYILMNQNKKIDIPCSLKTSQSKEIEGIIQSNLFCSSNR